MMSAGDLALIVYAGSPKQKINFRFTPIGRPGYKVLRFTFNLEYNRSETEKEVHTIIIAKK